MKDNEETIFNRRSLALTIAVVIFVVAVIIALYVGIKARHDRNATDVSDVVFTASTVTEPMETSPIVEIQTYETTFETTSEALSAPVSDETVPMHYIPEDDVWTYEEALTPEENILIYLTEYLGYSDAAACGIIANIAYETGWKFNPDVGNINNGAYGLIQWMGGRRRNLRSWCKENSKNYNTIPGQLDFMDWELQNDDPYGTYEYLLDCENDADGAYKAGHYFCYWYERPNNKKAASKARGNTARKYFKELVLGED